MAGKARGASDRGVLMEFLPLFKRLADEGVDFIIVGGVTGRFTRLGALYAGCPGCKILEVDGPGP